MADYHCIWGNPIVRLSDSGKSGGGHDGRGGEMEKKASANVPVRPVRIAPNRGDIWATDGRILATSVPFYELRFDPVAVDKKVFQEKVDSLAYCLSAFFKDASKESYRNKLVRARVESIPIVIS